MAAAESWTAGDLFWRAYILHEKYVCKCSTSLPKERQRKNKAGFAVLNIKMLCFFGIVSQGRLIKAVPGQLNHGRCKRKQPHKNSGADCPPFRNNVTLLQWIDYGDISITSDEKNMAD